MAVFSASPLNTDLPAARQQADITTVHRHLFARQFCQGREVLNIAGGQDFGGVILSQVAARVLAIDVDAASDGSTKEFRASGAVEFLEGSHENLFVPDGSVDVVVCVDAAAGASGYEKFLYEVRRVLRRGGIFVVSTPDGETSSAETEPAGTLSRAEFLNLLSRFFSRTHLGLQKMTSVSVALPYRPAAFAPEIFQRGDAQAPEATDELKGASHVIVVASNEPLPNIRWGVLVDDQILETLKDQVARCDISRVEKLEIDLKTANEAAVQLRHEIEDRDRRIAGIRVRHRPAYEGYRRS